MRKDTMLKWLLIGCFAVGNTVVHAQTNAAKGIAPKPLYRDPVYDGAADPVVIWNKHQKKWWMFYTNRRATINDSSGVKWVHGTRLGIAESTDGAAWNYVDTADVDYRPDEGYTFWAPDVIEEKGTYHMYLTYVPGTFSNWDHPRNIVHLTSKDLQHWKYESTLSLANQKVIDASVFKLTELHYENGTITCNRNEPVAIRLKK